VVGVVAVVAEATAEAAAATKASPLEARPDTFQRASIRFRSDNKVFIALAQYGRSDGESILPRRNRSTPGLPPGEP